jgi:hypothetical protein
MTIHSDIEPTKRLHLFAVWNEPERSTPSHTYSRRRIPKSTPRIAEEIADFQSIRGTDNVPAIHATTFLALGRPYHIPITIDPDNEGP